MKENKFRAWIAEEKRFWYFDLLGLLGSDDSDYGLLKSLIEKGVVDRCTGLKDMRGAEIYEGDVPSFGRRTHSPSDPIEFREGAFYSGDILLGELANRIEVIGNIYENPSY